MNKCIKFRMKNDEVIEIIVAENGTPYTGKEEVIGQIFTPSSTSNGDGMTMQVCGFSEAFYLWGCAIFEEPATSDMGDSYVFDDKGNKVFIQARDIQLKFSPEARLAKPDTILDRTALRKDNCAKCYNRPCTCENRIKFENPYTVKHGSDLYPRRPEDHREVAK